VADNIDTVWRKFFEHRTRTLWERFPGYYRALVVETNDPLDMMRVRFKSPDLHDFDLPAQDCPWAVPAHDLGGKRAGRFSHPCIGDWVWITFERGHPYGPIWTGFATPTRRRFYTYPQIFQVTPLSVNEDGRPDGKPNDFDRLYLPKDGRPMMHGWQDRYGNLDIHSAVGFFPDEHKDPPPTPDHDAIQNIKFQQLQAKPEVNDPDKKYMARVTKYGTMLVMSDQGYYWKKNGDLGEFTGRANDDEQFETKRWQYLQKVLNEGQPKTSDGRHDARRFGVTTRYGSRIEARDTGWAQEGPIASKSRDGEWTEPRTLSKETQDDFRWIKIRTKGGMLWQAYDKGCHPQDDKFVKRRLLDELGARSEREDLYWKNKDARWIRSVTRHGIKIVQDDRGSDPVNADGRELPRGNGVLIKGRRSPGVKTEPMTGSPRGFHFEFNENDEANHSTWASPMGLSMELNDRYQYMMLAASLGRNWTPKFEGLKENEFIRKPMMLKNPEFSAHHLKLDHDNEYVRLKTRGGGGPRPMMPAERSGARFQQGVEMRDGRSGDGTWTEIVDSEHRGFWWTRKQQLGIWRAKRSRTMYMWMHDRRREIAIYNGESNGEITIYCAGKVNIVSDKDVGISAGGNVDIRAGRAIRMQAGDSRLTLNGSGVHTNKDYFGQMLHARICKLRVTMKGKQCKCRAVVTGGCPKPGGARVEFIDKPNLPPLEPTDRGKTYNDPFVECPRQEVEHPL
jgi:hypothetical protein